MILSLPKPKSSMLFAEKHNPLIDDSNTPPNDSEPLHIDPFHDSCQTALSIPIVKTSNVPAAQLHAPTIEVPVILRASQGDHTPCGSIEGRMPNAMILL
jgi:hypothetical protein